MVARPLLRSFLITILLTGLFPAGITAQEKIATLKGGGDGFAIDHLGYVYLVQGDELRQYNATGKIRYRYSDKNLGRITSLDVSSSLKPVLFYRDLSRMVVLDNTLSVQGSPVSLQEHDLDQAILMCPSVNDHYWFFDQRTMGLIRTNRSFREKQATGNLVQALGTSLDPVSMQEHNSKLYLNDPEKGLFLFDIYGTFLQQIPIQGILDFQVVNNKLLYTSEKGFFAYNMRSFAEQRITLPVKEHAAVRLVEGKIYIRRKDEVLVYRYQNFPPPDQGSR